MSDARIAELEAALAQANLDRAIEKVELQKNLTKALNRVAELQVQNAELTASASDAEAQARLRISENFKNQVENEAQLNNHIAQLAQQLMNAKDDLRALENRFNGLLDEHRERTRELDNAIEDNHTLKDENRTLKAQLEQSDQNLAETLGRMEIRDQPREPALDAGRSRSGLDWDLKSSQRIDPRFLRDRF